MKNGAISFLLLIVAIFTWAAANAAEESVEYLFVKSAKSVAFDKDTLALKQVSPSVIYFSDRPNRIAGHLTLDRFLALWDEGKDSFADDPPNATLSIFDGDKVTNVVMELENPRLEDDTLVYNVQILDGEAPPTGGISSLFIDGVARGAALGAVGGAIAGNAGKGAAIGAGVGAVGGAIRR